jgi:hypothetical protein
MDLLALLFIFLAGILTKFADMIADEGLQIRKIFSYAVGIVYGMLIAYVLVTHPLLAPLGMAVVLSVLLAEKIDRKPHNIGIASMFLFLAIWGFPQIDMVLIAVFLAASLLDEAVSDLADRKRIKGIAGKIAEYRPVLEITAFLVSLITWQWIIFIGMLSFDVGYRLTTELGKRFK